MKSCSVTTWPPRLTSLRRFEDRCIETLITLRATDFSYAVSVFWGLEPRRPTPRELRRTRSPYTCKTCRYQGYHSQKQINILLFLGTFNSPFSTSHVYPPGQQCLSSLQQTACETGQQPYNPECSLQHVLPLAHSCFLSGQSTAPEDSETGRAGDFTKVIIFCTSPLLLSWHVPLEVHVDPIGQQCTLSLQHTAWSKWQQE